MIFLCVRSVQQEMIMHALNYYHISTYNLKIKHVVEPHSTIQYKAVLGVNKDV